jgi:hypothetical protein
MDESLAKTAVAGMHPYFAAPPAPIYSYKLVSAGTGQLVASKGARGTSQYTVSMLGRDAVKLERTDAGATDQLVVMLATIVGAAYSEVNELTIVVSD